MSRILRSLFSVFLLASLVGPISGAFAAPTSNSELEGILRKIEARHYRWVAIQADVILFFATTGGSRAMCGGELLYQRLDERILLSCVDSQQELVFVFRTLDRRFDLYLPAQNTVYHGSIFDLEDSPDIESHLKARDLYRALKPMAVDPRRTKLERTNAAVTSLDVYSQKDGKENLVRKLYLTPEGDVRGELFYDPKGRPVTEIQRYGFHKLSGRTGPLGPVIFPKKITIASPETKKGSALFFTQVKAMDTIDPLEFILRVPYGTKEVFLDEKDPRFQSSKISGSEAPLAARFAARQFKTVEKPTKVEIAPQASSKKEKPPQETSKQKSAPVVVPMKNKAPLSSKDEIKNKDADIVLENQAPADLPPVPNDQTTLDPSVEPAA